MNIEILKIENDTITFQTDARLTTATNASPAEDRRLPGTFTCAKSDLWTPPTVWTRDPPEPSPPIPEGDIKAGGRGLLYLCKGALLEPGLSARGPCFVRGWYPGPDELPPPHPQDVRLREPSEKLDDEVLLQFKWPDCRWQKITSPLSLQPTCVLVTGMAENGTIRTVNLLDPNLAQSSQDIDWNGASWIRLHLTPQGLQLFGPTASSPLSIWPIRIEVTGTPTFGLGFEATVDLRDQKVGGYQQHLRWTDTASIEVQLTDTAFAEFGIPSEGIEGALAHVLQVLRDNPQLQQDLRRIQVAWPALDKWHHTEALRTRGVLRSWLVMELFERKASEL
ncbi:MAG TPA: hypothetical protein VN253_19120 [Kofleriaceae bacterium]|nr:hypothetical protein [Kofleriaceae bacterium]